MKKVIICGSISAAKDILDSKEYLEKEGYKVEIPKAVINMETGTFLFFKGKGSPTSSN